MSDDYFEPYTQEQTYTAHCDWCGLREVKLRGSVYVDGGQKHADFTIRTQTDPDLYVYVCWSCVAKALTKGLGEPRFKDE